MKDPVGRGIIAGITGVIAINLAEVIMIAVKLSKTFLWEVGALPFLSENAAKTPVGIGIGIFSHIFVGIIIAVIIAYYLSATGTELAIIKGIGVSLIAGFIVLGVYIPLRGILAEMQSSPGDVLSAFIDHTVFGAVAALVIKKFQLPSSSEQNNQTNKVKIKGKKEETKIIKPKKI